MLPNQYASPSSKFGPLRVGLFGASSGGVAALTRLESEPTFRAVAFFDNDPRRIGQTLHGLPIRSPKSETFRDCDVVVISSIFKASIFKQLVTFGLTNRIALDLDDLCRRFGPIPGNPTDNSPPASEMARERSTRWTQHYAHSSATARNTAPTFHAITIATPDFAHAALRLAQSFLTFHPEAVFTVFWMTHEVPTLPATISGDERIRHETVGAALGSALKPLLLRYTLGELCGGAVRPLLFAHVLARRETRVLLYFDADILVFNRLDAIIGELAHSTLLLTPHRLSLNGDPESDRLILASGTFNSGFYGLRQGAEADDFCVWLANRVVAHCSIRPHQAVYLDQRWLDMVPGIFPGLGIHRDPGANVAFWNLAERGLQLNSESPMDFRCADGPLRFFHFSGFRIATPSRIHELATQFGFRDNTLLPLVDAYAYHVRPLNSEVLIEAQRASIHWHRQHYFPAAWVDLLRLQPGDEELLRIAAETFSTSIGDLKQLLAARAL